MTSHKLRARSPIAVLLAASALPCAAVAQTNAGERSRTGLSLEEQTQQQIQDFRWTAAIAEYRAAIAANDRNIAAWLGLGQVLSWQGRLTEARAAYQRAAAIDPDNREAVLGIAATYRFARDYRAARRLYDDALRRWPEDADARLGKYQFEREANPRFYAFYENDLSFVTRKIGAAMPVFGRGETYAEYEEEERPGSNVRKDKKLGYIHNFGFNHFVEVSARAADFKYIDLASVTDFAAIDTFVEYRLRYTRPLTWRHIATVRYSHRPTTLQVTRGKFAAKKIEAEVRSQWSPRFATVIGTGGLRDLDGDAETTRDFRNTILVRAGVEYAVTPRLQLAANYITNPDLDNTINGTSLALVNYQISGNWSSIYRLRFDDYKEGANQTAHYLAARYAPGRHIWTEFGLKYVKRGDRKGIYPLVSLIYRL